MSAVLAAVMDRIVSELEGMSLLLGTAPVAVVKRKLPVKEESIDPAVQLTVHRLPSGGGWRWYAFPSASRASGTVQVTYPLAVTLAAPCDGDFLGELDEHGLVRERIARHFARPSAFAGVPEVFEVTVKDGVFLDRKDLADNYDYQTVGIDVITLEPGA